MNRKLIFLNTMIVVSIGSISFVPVISAEATENQRGGIESSLATSTNPLHENPPTESTNDQTEPPKNTENKSTTENEQKSIMDSMKEFEEGTNLIKEEHEGIRAEIEKTVQELLKIQADIAHFNKQIQQFEQAITDNNKIIEETKANINENNQEIKKLEKEIHSLNEGIQKRLEILQNRARALQRNGGKVEYVNVLVGSSNFSNFVDRVFAVATLLKADKNLIEQQKSDLKKLEDKQAIVKEKLEGLTAMKIEYEGMQANIVEQKRQQDVLKEAVERKEQESLDFMAELYKNNRDLALEAEAIKEKFLNEQDGKFEINSESTLESIEYINQFARTASNTSDGLVEAIINSYSYIGNSVYVFGAGRNQIDIDNGRFDCSGFVNHVFSEAGIHVGNTTDTLKNEGVKIPSSAMQFGDLVFFDTYKIDGHVGIYIGGGKFLGSQSSTGVAIADMTTGYWKEKFNGRVIRIQ
ncbi:coiled-coil domain-containing protein [Bacillus sp. REN16]|uniref:coiled-coil domain-containing protein n=1 Tax=Bacillus sp. REN16 TaxID=2887296 RepID=UPI001E4B9CDD|nr:C40 family peptidase [Bacillus sp. REN16]MCC3356786.1 NlpC/P60 family protein [Bacillus sp. REN16]